MSSYDYYKNALSIGNAKEAALYCDIVVPFDLTAGATGREEKHSIAINTKCNQILESLIPGCNDVASFYRGYFDVSEAFWTIIALDKWFANHRELEGFFELDQEYLDTVSRSVKLTYDEDIKRIASRIENGLFDLSHYRDKTNNMLNNGLASLNISTFSTWYDHFYDWSDQEKSGQEKLVKEENILVSLTGLDLVDVDKLSWNKILEIRKDEKSAKALRELRLFLHSIPDGYDNEAVKDLILSKYDKYCDAVKWWKLDTIKKPLSMMASKEGLAATAIGGLVALTTGVPIDPVSILTIKEAILTGAAFNLAATGALSISSILVDKDKLSQSAGSEVRYLHHLNRKTK